ncbi:5,10-methenyltetrahydrofolate synthetase [Gonapodya prolifera JEL478]|uniref:5-formyltetrahydrofolate cyclo-ligase n=1 Tax=Gonapodya prolifera (strain JEL478) TaxID=1344416 RepID=A0A139AVX0_GONPJ|nr:5,10-methenyltetrahydrofolate synthetase [Gonapodya prolifera JEL478]|eukprot:KXS20857.1 5,10-methenyltetrahydrofolate synthetase [Gonapodya prolifera JEL478]
MHTQVQAAKAALRKEIKSRLAAIPAEQIAIESGLVLQRLRDLKVYRDAKAVSVYLSMKGEVETKEIVKDIFAQGKLCFVPRWDGQIMHMVHLTSLPDYLSLPLNRWGIPEPPHGEERQVAFPDGKGGGFRESGEKLDLVLVPGVAFDSHRNRLGHGKGYYDSYLARYARLTHNDTDDPLFAMPTTVALALRAQIVESVPVGETDWRVDEVLTADGVVKDAQYGGST